MTAAPSQRYGWTIKKAANFNIHSHAAIKWDDTRILVCGGYQANVLSAQCHFYHTDSDFWSPVDYGLASPRYGHDMFRVNGAISVLHALSSNALSLQIRFTSLAVLPSHSKRPIWKSTRQRILVKSFRILSTVASTLAWLK